MSKEKKFLKLLFVFCVFIFIADRIDDYLLRKEIKEFMFEEGGLELTGKYKCVNLTYDAAFIKPEANDYLPTPAAFCYTDVIDENKIFRSFRHDKWDIQLHMDHDALRFMNKKFLMEPSEGRRTAADLKRFQGWTRWSK